MAEFVLVVVCLVVSITLYAFFFSSLRWAKRRRTEDFRCPGCNFLVNANDVEHYGYVCPDCRTDWRVHPLKNEYDEEMDDDISDEGPKSEKHRSERSRNRLVR